MERQIRIVVASPSDVQRERDLVPEVVDELNRGIAAEMGYRIALSRWETDAYPGFHAEGPQGICDEVLRIEQCDVLVGIFWNRFGTPCADAGAGTEHEFRRAYHSWKRYGRPHIMFYFNEKAFNLTTREQLEQRARVVAFREAFPVEGLRWTYRGGSQFQKLLRQHLTAWLRNYDPSSFEEFTDYTQAIQAYRTGFSGFYSRWDLAPVGVAQVGGRRPVDVHLDEMYLPLRMAAAFSADESNAGMEYSPTTLIVQRSPLLVSGPAGSGKTTWIRWTFRRLLRDESALPLMVELRQLAQCWTKQAGPGPARSLETYFQGFVTEHAGALVGDLFLDMIDDETAPRPILLIDGWDELGQLGEDVRRKLVAFMSKHPRVRVVVTSRPYNQPPSHSDGFEEVKIQPLSNFDILWFAANFYQRCYGEDQRAAHAYVDRFMTALARSPEATALARTALLLTMMLLISRSSPLPDKRHLLYQKCVENLLTALPERRREEGALVTPEQWRPDDIEETFRITAHLAFQVQSAGYSSKGRGAIIRSWDEMKALLPKQWLDSQRSKFLNWLKGPAGLLVDRTDETLSFSHLSFQEYLAAWYLEQTIEGDSGRLQMCLEKIEERTWWETLRLWAALVGGKHPAKLRPVLQELLKTDDGICFASTVLADGLGGDELFQEVTPLLTQLIRSRWPQDRPEVVKAWLSSGQELRREALGREFAIAAGHGTWVDWVQYRAFTKSIGVAELMPLPTENANGRALLEAAYFPIKTPEQVALGRLLASGSPFWPGDPVELSLLQVWPTPRRLLGHRLQVIASLGANKNDILNAFRELTVQRIQTKVTLGRSATQRECIRLMKLARTAETQDLTLLEFIFGGLLGVVGSSYQAAREFLGSKETTDVVARDALRYLTSLDKSVGRVFGVCMENRWSEENLVRALDDHEIRVLVRALLTSCQLLRVPAMSGIAKTIADRALFKYRPFAPEPSMIPVDLAWDWIWDRTGGKLDDIDVDQSVREFIQLLGRLRSGNGDRGTARKVSHLWLSALTCEEADTVPSRAEGNSLSEVMASLGQLRYGALASRAAWALFESSRDNSAAALISRACSLSLNPKRDSRSFRRALRVYREDEEPLWPALARFLTRRESAPDIRLLDALARAPDERRPPLSWGLRYIVRGDVILEDGSEVTLDELSALCEVPELPTLGPLPPDDARTS